MNFIKRIFRKKPAMAAKTPVQQAAQTPATGVKQTFHQASEPPVVVLDEIVNGMGLISAHVPTSLVVVSSRGENLGDSVSIYSTSSSMSYSRQSHDDDDCSSRSSSSSISSYSRQDYDDTCSSRSSSWSSDSGSSSSSSDSSD